MDDETHLTKTEARGGAAPGVMRYVLGISLVAIVAIFAIILFVWR